MAKITPDGKTYYYGTDMLGSTTVLFDDAGNAVWKGEISVFGDVVLGEWIGEELFDERVRFTGKDYDEVTGLYYFNARWYDPRLGRFTSEDPVRDGMNWHVYTYNNPLKYTDPTGLDPHNMTIEEADRRGWAGPGDGDPGSDRKTKKRKKWIRKERTPDAAIDSNELEERSLKPRNGGWKQRRMERGGFISEGTYSSDEIDSLYSLYKLDRALTAAEREGHIDQPLAEDLRNAIGDANMLVLYWSSGGGSKENIEDNGILWGDLINASTSLLADGLVIAGLILVTTGTEGVAAPATIPMGIHFSIQAGAHINDFINALNGTPNNKMNGYQALGNDLSTIIGGKDDGVLNKVGQVGDDASLVYSLTTDNYSPKNVKDAYGIANNISSGLNKAVDIVKSWF